MTGQIPSYDWLMILISSSLSLSLFSLLVLSLVIYFSFIHVFRPFSRPCSVVVLTSPPCFDKNPPRKFALIHETTETVCSEIPLSLPVKIALCRDLPVSAPSSQRSSQSIDDISSILGKSKNVWGYVCFGFGRDSKFEFCVLELFVLWNTLNCCEHCATVGVK